MTRVLFVDDEPRVLDGLRLSLRSKRKVWDMVFVEGGLAAVAEITANPVDVVVSDMRMPGMSGADLLGKVAEIRPRRLGSFYPARWTRLRRCVPRRWHTAF